jgi:hypothetical protein
MPFLRILPALNAALKDSGMHFIEALLNAFNASSTALLV